MINNPKAHFRITPWLGRQRWLVGWSVGVALAVLAMPASALQVMVDDELATVQGQDGVDITLNTSNLSTEALGQRLNSGNANLRAGLEIQNITYTPVDIYGNDKTGTFTGELTLGIDMGRNGSGVPGGVLSLDLPNRVRFHTDNVMLFGNASAANDATSKVGGLGEVAYDASGRLVFSNVGGLFNADGEEFMLFGKLDNANMFWRQQSGDAKAPYLVMTDGKTFWHAYGAHVGVDRYGLVQTAKLIDLGLEYTTRFKQPDPTATTVTAPVTRMSLCTAGTTCTTATDAGIGMYRFGWGGTIVDPYLSFAGGGIHQAASGVYDAEGLHLVAKWNFLSNDGEASDNIGGGYAPGVNAGNFDVTGVDTDNKHTGFHWFLGNESDPGSATVPVSIELANWRNLPGAAYGSEFDIRLGMVNNGQGGANALCFGSRDCVKADGTYDNTKQGQLISMGAPTGTGLGTTVRNSSIRSMSEGIRARDTHFPNTVPSGWKDFDWGLINSFSHMDSNIYIYPKTSTVLKRGDGTNGSEIVADLILMGQTLDDNNGTFRNSRTTGCAPATPCITGGRSDYNGNRATNFGNGSHMLIADTSSGASNGIGMMDMSFLLMARQTHIIMKPMTSLTDVGASNYATNQYLPANYISSKLATAAQAYTGGLDFTSGEVRYNLYATFGGLDLSPAHQADAYDYYPSYKEACPSGKDCPNVLVGGINQWNYEGFFNFRLSPHPASLSNQPNSQYLGYSLAYRATSYDVADTISGGGVTADLANSPAYLASYLGSANPLIGAHPSGRCVASGSCTGVGTMFGTAEPSQQGKLVVTGAITGDMAFINGKLMITAGEECMTGAGACPTSGGTIDYSKSTMPGLTFSHNILIGMSAYGEVNARAAILGGISTLPGGDTKQPFLINRMEFDGKNLGSIAVPKGNYFGIATLKPQRL